MGRPPRAESRTHHASNSKLRHHGQHAVAWSVEARSADGKIVRVGFSNSYRGTSDEAAITRIAGEHAVRYFKQSFGLKIKGDLIPDAAVEPLLAELQESFARHGASAALSAKATIKPTKEFHTARHTLFSVEQKSRTRQGRADQREGEDEARARRERR